MTAITLDPRDLVKLLNAHNISVQIGGFDFICTDINGKSEAVPMDVHCVLTYLGYTPEKETGSGAMRKALTRITRINGSTGGPKAMVSELQHIAREALAQQEAA